MGAISDQRNTPVTKEGGEVGDLGDALDPSREQVGDLVAPRRQLVLPNHPVEVRLQLLQPLPLAEAPSSGDNSAH